MREPMHQPPRGHRRVIVVERPRVEVGDAAHQHGFHICARRLERRIFRPLSENGPEHEAKEPAVLVGELDIGKTRPNERIGAPGRILHRRGELLEAFGGDGSEEVFLVGEMAIGGCSRHPDPAGGLAQTNRMQPVLVQNLTGRSLKRNRQVPVTIGSVWNPFIPRLPQPFTVSTRGLG